jgi:hypothetical protein
MLRFVDTGNGFILAYPIWVGLVVVVGLVLGWYAARKKDMAWRNRLTLFIGSVGFIVTGLYFVTFKAVITPESGRVYGFPLKNDTIYWTDASSVSVEERPGKGGVNYFLVVPRRSGETFEMPFYGLPATERERIVGFVATRIQR